MRLIMTDKKNMPLVPAFILDTLINILYIADIIPEWIFRLGFLVVIISCLIMNVNNLRANKKRKKTPNDVTSKPLAEPAKKWFVILSISSALLWAPSYFIAIFVK